MYRGTAATASKGAQSSVAPRIEKRGVRTTAGNIGKAHGEVHHGDTKRMAIPRSRNSYGRRATHALAKSRRSVSLGCRRWFMFTINLQRGGAQTERLGRASRGSRV